MCQWMLLLLATLMMDVASKELLTNKFFIVVPRVVLSIQWSLDRSTAKRGCVWWKFLRAASITTIATSGSSLFGIVICAILPLVRSKTRMFRTSNLHTFLPIPLSEHGMPPHVDFGIFGIAFAGESPIEERFLKFVKGFDFAIAMDIVVIIVSIGMSVTIVPEMFWQNFLFQYHGVDNDETLIIGKKGNDIADIGLVTLRVGGREDGHEYDGKGRRGFRAVVVVGMRGFLGSDFFRRVIVAIVAVEKTFRLFLFGVAVMTTVRMQCPLDIAGRTRRRLHIGLHCLVGISSLAFRAIGLGGGSPSCTGPSTVQRGRRRRTTALATRRRRRRRRRDVRVDRHSKSHIQIGGHCPLFGGAAIHFILPLAKEFLFFRGDASSIVVVVIGAAVAIIVIAVYVHAINARRQQGGRRREQ
mmetsp:Transcript_24136/g.50782  ORF Transcript_24136/g.50782 Transcript_24136/m.50782 type:complete len:413 (-) Transcript_24136:436-1674(-)